MRILACSIICLLLAACSTTPQPESYLLRSSVTPGAGGQLTPGGITLVSVDVATYIDQPGLVIETASGQVRTAKQNLWAEPLRHSLMDFLANELSQHIGKTVNVGLQSAGKDDVRLLVEIDQLHGTAQGDAVLVADWIIKKMVDGEPVESSYRFSQVEPLKGDGYDALVSAEKELLVMFAHAISKSIN